MGLIDTHCHLGFEELAADVEGVLARSREAGVDRWVTVGTDTEQNEKAVELARKYDDVYAAVGYHPHHAKDVGEGDIARMKELAGEEKVAAIGEAGLDYHYNFSHQEAQREVFRRQLDAAREMGKPVIVHSRNAFDEAVGILDEYRGELARVVFHCYGGSAEQTEALLERGYYVSFTGIVTFKKCEDVREVAKMVPVERMMIETDCPYISPEPVRGSRPCEPAMLVHTARRLSEVLGMGYEEFARAVSRTSEEFFKLRSQD
jgi:TatD DNase family protein